MIDHILIYADDAARDAAWPAPEDNPPSWTDGERSIMPTRIVHARASYDAEGNETSPEVTAPGSYLVIRTPSRDAEIEAMAECIIATDAGLMADGQPYVLKCSLQPETVLGQVDPVWAGSPYAIPVGSPASALDDWRV
ncbi:hypothetical protein GB927_012895 [Shinella sp. CPCC 100929]|uniref:Uncharacterized protein n=1 Tax=Shinella lacus TaxID=2654216 RepID=A0ABT1R6X0_9HYPH|nr:hypothetical protein [Shinella lacus]MCQ4630943.1 hypothetical protein [Shinella lacus]